MQKGIGYEKSWLVANIFTVFLGIVLFLDCNCTAQTQPVLCISNDSPNTVLVSWGSEAGSAYRLLFTSALSSPTVWSPFEDIYATDTNTLVLIRPTISQSGFFKLQKLDGSTMDVEIFSPTNGQTIGGVLTVRIGADVGGGFSEADVYLDGALIGLAQLGALDFSFDSSHFANGNHLLQVVAQDSENNQTSSAAVTVNFQNSVRWLDAETLFQSFVPIVVQSDIFPADWTITVLDVTGAVAKTIAGTTSDGNISTNWDGTDDSGNALPDQAAYTISINVGDGSASPQASSVPGAQDNNSSPSDGSNSDLPPPLPPMPPGFEQPPSAVDVVSQPRVIQRVAAVMVPIMAPDGATSSGSSGSSSTVVWREPNWRSAEIALARQKITGIPGLTFDGVCANLLNNVQTLVSDAQDGIGGDRAVYGGGVTVVNNANDWSGVQTSLASQSPQVTEFYWYGHGSADGNSIGGYVNAKTLSAYLGNYYLPPVTNSTGMTARPKVITHLPFNFVFLDGCRTGTGMLPEAFGIPKAIPGASYARDNKQRRAFMGWNGKVTASILDTSSLTWSLDFWTAWLNGPNVPLATAITVANSKATPSGGIVVYGDTTLTWAN